MKFAGVGLAAGLAGSVAAAVSFEQEFANVKKTVQATPKEFEKVRTGILDLSEKIPESANSLADLAGEAGALGVKAKDLVGFTKIASQLGTATTMTSEEAADGLARLGNIMDQRSVPATKRMASTLVALGNKGASTESEISAMSLRIAGAGKTVGLTSQQVLGLGAALANLGIRSEMGGSAISRVLLAMNAAIAKGGPELQLWAKTAGMSAKEFADAFKKDPTTAIADFSEGLHKIQQGGGDVTAVLNDLGTAAHTSMNEIRVRDTLLRVASNTDQFTTAMGQANRAWDNNNALANEAHQRYKTLASQLTLLKNSIVRTGIDIGTGLLPDLRDMVKILRDPKLTTDEKISGILDKISEMASAAGPKLAGIGAKIMLDIVKGMVTTFTNTDNPLIRLFEVAGFIRLVGGPGALRGLGMKMGSYIGAGAAAGTTESMMSGSAAGSGLAFVGAESGGASRLSKIKAGAFTFGKVVLGTAIGFGILNGVTNTLTESHADRSIGGVLQDNSVNFFRTFGINLGNTTAENFSEAFTSRLQSVSEADILGPQISNTTIDKMRARIAQRMGANADFQPSADAVQAKLQQALSRKGAKPIHARNLFSDIWDQMTPDEHRMAQSVIEAGRGAARLLQDHHIDLPADFIRTNPDAAKAMEAQLQSGFGALKSGALTRMGDIKKVFKRNQGVIADSGLPAQSKAVREATAENMRLMAESIGQSMKKSGNYTKAGLERIQNLIEHADIITATAHQAAGFTRTWAKGLDTNKEATEQNVKAVIKKMERLPPATQNIAEKTMLQQLHIQHKQGDLSKKNYDKLVSMIVGHFGQVQDKGTSKTAGMAKGVMTIVGGMVDAVSGKGGFGTLEKNVNSALSAFGTQSKSKINFTIEKAAKAAGSFLGSLQAGGKAATVPGHTGGDRHLLSLGGMPIAWVESGEDIFVGNRTMSNSLNELNTRIPRKAGGGSVTGDTAGLVPQFMGALQAMSAGTHTGINVLSGYRSRAEQEILYQRYLNGTGNLAAPPGTSHHELGIAADIAPGREVFGSAAGKYGLGFTVPTESWHIELLNAAAAGKMGPQVKKLARLLLHGQKGGLRSLGQGALDKVRQQANRYLMAHASAVGGTVPAKGQYDMGTLEKLWSGTGSNGDPHLMAAIAMAESGGNPSADNGIARGLWQIISGTWSAYGKGSWDNAFNPNMNAQAAHRILAGSGLGAWDTYNSGAYQQFMQAGGRLRLPPFGGVFHNGGTVPGPRGAERTIIAKSGEAVSRKRQEIRIVGDLQVNWKTGRAVIRGIAEEAANEAVNGQRRLGNQIDRMGSSRA
jgi:TP901 family phage tail tape measure protein